jgi:hypothetical protein
VLGWMRGKGCFIQINVFKEIPLIQERSLQDTATLPSLKILHR